MKQHFLNILSAGTLAAGMISAQTGPTHTAPNPATMAARQVDRLSKLLTLTPAQQTQATEIFTNAATSEAALRTNMHTAQTSLRTAVKGNDTAAIDNLASQIGSLTGQELDISSKAEAAFYATLTADQQTKYAALHGGGAGGPGGMMRGGPQGAHFGDPRR